MVFTKFITGRGITLTNNEIKDTMKIIKSSENKWILLKGNTKKIINQKRVSLVH